MTTHRLQVVAVAVAAGIALSSCSAAGTASDADSDRAKELAQQLNENLADEGLVPIDEETATSLYGTDGGVSCENVGELQQQLSLSQFGNNSGNLRRVVLDPSLVEYDLTVIDTYCPDQADELQDELGDLGTGETIPTPSD